MIALLPKLRRFALGLTRDSGAADDLVQSACQKAIERIHQWESGTRLDSWMFRIIQTTHIDNKRAQRRRSGHLRLASEHDKCAHDGEAAAVAYLTLKHVRDAILNLSEEQRAVVLLVCVEGCSYKEAAGILQIPIGTLTSRLVRARTALLSMTGALEEAVSVDSSLSAGSFRTAGLEKA